MSRIEERIDVPFVVEVARMTIDSHDAGRRCQCCTDDGCEQDAWARQRLAEHRSTRARTIDRPQTTAGGARRAL